MTERAEVDRPKRDWRVDMLVQDRSDEVTSTKPPAEDSKSAPQSGAVSGLLGFLSASPVDAGPTSALQPDFRSSAFEEAASRWLQQTFIDERTHKKGDHPRPPCFLAEGLTVDVHGTVLGVSQAMDVFRGMLVVLYTSAQVIHTASEHRFGASLVLCNAAFQCYPGIMLACGYSSYEKFLREWPDPGTYSAWDLSSTILLPLVSAWICSFAFCFLKPGANIEDPGEALKQVLLFGGSRAEGTEILLACSINFSIVFIAWRPVSRVLQSVKVRVWHDCLALALALSPLALMLCMKTLLFSEEEGAGMVVTFLPYLLFFHAGILLAACWDRFLSQLQPVGFQTVTDSIHLLPWDVFKSWLLCTSIAWWTSFVFFMPLGQVALVHDLAALRRPGVQGFLSPLWVMALLWPLAVSLVMCGLMVTAKKFNTVLRLLQLELWHVGKNMMYYMVVVNIFLASQQRSDGHRNASLGKCLLGATSILAASRFIHFMAGLSRQAVQI
ncbi:unnamed protein product [Effrenium voratum]|uniref:Uncharacterized protein n=1 Tax=Effrenium voratum TaxID=2562239 RepID=A0AA36MRE6_9DINO|nr:unnamed protein product [Effrenium voratum]CAJ1420116.1 unnamed protein product [Effrenium voratum]